MHIADFTWSGGPAALGPALAKHVRDAELAGLTRITVMDHFWQIGDVGSTDAEMLEAYTLLGYVAAHTSTARLHTLVTGVIYREPALLAKAVSTLDVLSGGRAGLGIGAAWNQDESLGLGFQFPSAKERLDRLEEAIQICMQMWSPSEAPFDGNYYQLGRTLNIPQPLQEPHPYLMIGGGGEQRTLKLVARYADACNIFTGLEAAHKLDVLRAHCDTVGRDYDKIEKTTTMRIDPGSTADDIVRAGAEMAKLGFTTMYVYASGITEPPAIIDVMGTAASQLR
jgi:F420-dependent oxidoreductase-like protein